MAVTMILSYEYLAFYKDFFVLDYHFEPFFQTLAAKQQEFSECKMREDYSKKINSFLLK